MTSSEITKRKAILLAAVCASISSSSTTSAFTTGLAAVKGPIHPCASRCVGTSSSLSSSSSSPSDDEMYFFTAPGDPETETTTSSSDFGMISAEQQELETMQVEDQELMLPSSSPSPPTPKPTAVMDVDGNGTGALMNRSHTAGGVDAPLMVTTHKTRAFPIDSGKEGMAAQDTKARTRPKNGIEPYDPTRPKTRLVRYKLPPQQQQNGALQPKEEPTTKFVLASSLAANNNNGKLAKAIQSQEKPKLSGPKLVRYNGPDVEDTTDFDGMEKASVKKKRNRVLDLKKANLVRYQGFSQQKRLEETAEPEETRNQQRKTLAEDVGYANRYTGLTDYSLAKKTGLAVNKPISLWVERDKFL